MSDPPPQKEPDKPRPDDAPSKGDIAALGIGCLVFLIFLAMVIIVAMSRE